MSEDPSPLWENAFIRRMKKLREGRGISQADLAKQVASTGLPVHQPTIQRIESGSRPVRLNEAAAIADVLRAKLADMIRPATAQSAQDELSKTLQFLVTVSESHGVGIAGYAVDLLEYVEDAKNAHGNYLTVCESLGVHPDNDVLTTYAEDLRFGLETAELFMKSAESWEALAETFPGKTVTRGWQQLEPFSWRQSRGLDA